MTTRPSPASSPATAKIMPGGAPRASSPADSSRTNTIYAQGLMENRLSVVNVARCVIPVQHYGVSPNRESCAEFGISAEYGGRVCSTHGRHATVALTGAMGVMVRGHSLAQRGAGRARVNLQLVWQK